MRHSKCFVQVIIHDYYDYYDYHGLLAFEYTYGCTASEWTAQSTDCLKETEKVVCSVCLSLSPSSNIKISLEVM